jgi:hypothetical protein
MPKYNTTANGLASLGRNGDTMLMHVNPEEVAGLAALFGTEPTVNPDTGLPEAFGWGSMISGFVGSVLSPLMGSAMFDPVKEAATEAFKLGEDSGIADIFGFAGSGLAGAATNAATGAIGAGLSGGNIGSAAKAGALTGAALGGYGGAEAENLLGRPDIKTAANPSLLTDASMGYGQMGLDETPASPSFTDRVSGNLSRAFDNNLGSVKGFKNYLSEYKEPIMLGGTTQAGLESMFDAPDAIKQQEEQKLALLRQAGIDPSKMRYSYSFTNRGFSDGGAVGYAGEFGLPVQAYIPEHAIESFKKEGGLGALRMAHGGYINTAPFDPDTAYPQSMIERAKPYPAAAPQRHEVVEGYEEGGFVDGEGDGMSDDVEATIDGEEEVRVADGEVIIPKAIVDMFGVEALDNMLKRVRMAAYGTAQQVKQDAGKEVVLDMMD